MLVLLSHAPFPFFFKLQLPRAFPRFERQEIGHQPVEFRRFIEHGKVPGTFKYNAVRLAGQVVFTRLRPYGFIVLAVYEKGGFIERFEHFICLHGFVFFQRFFDCLRVRLWRFRAGRFVLRVLRKQPIG
jgi:hypothetical protein